jgi:uncharacterized glyoxalase superfamily protein PhnB
MNRDYKPKGYSSVAVYVMADGAQRVIDFLKVTFDAEELRRSDRGTALSRMLRSELTTRL